MIGLAGARGYMHVVINNESVNPLKEEGAQRQRWADSMGGETLLSRQGRCSGNDYKSC
jgi:hypothetical protein